MLLFSLPNLPMQYGISVASASNDAQGVYLTSLDGQGSATSDWLEDFHEILKTLGSPLLL